MGLKIGQNCNFLDFLVRPRARVPTSNDQCRDIVLQCHDFDYNVVTFSSTLSISARVIQVINWIIGFGYHTYKDWMFSLIGI